MALRAGWLVDRIRILSTVAEDDGHQTVQGEPTVFATLSADCIPTTDGERARADQTQAVIAARFLVRSSATTRQIDATMTLEFEGRPYGISSVKRSMSWRGVALGPREALEISATARAEALS